MSTTAIKDGHRGGHVPPLHLGSSSGINNTNSTGGQQRFGHQHNASTNSLEAERADRISRLTGLSGMTTLRPSYAANRGSVASGGGGAGNRFSGGISSSQATPTSSGGGGGGGFMSGGMAVPGPLTPAFFDAQGQPVAITKMSTVGTASATNSLSGRTLGDGDTVDGSTMTEEDDDVDIDDDDIRSMGTNYHYVSTGHGGSIGGGGGGIDGRDDRDDADAMMMDDDNLDAASRSAGGYEYDRMSDDGSASLVGFGEGAGSTVSGPIYHRRPLPPTTSSAGAMAANNAMVWATLERTNSGLSDMAVMGSVSGASATGGATTSTAPLPMTLPPLGAAFGGGARREFGRSPLEHFRDVSTGGSSSNGGDGNLAVLQERRDARFIDGMTIDDRSASAAAAAAAVADDDVFVDTTIRGPVPIGTAASATATPPPLMGSIIQAHPSALRETQRPRSHQQQQQNQYYHYGHNHGHNHSGGMIREHEAAGQLLQGAARGFEGHDGPATAATTTAAATRHSAGAGYGSGGGRLGTFDFEERR